MSNFERVYQIDPEREMIEKREKHPIIEIHHFNKSEQMNQETPEVKASSDVPIAEEKITKGKKDEKIKSKTPKRKLKKVHSKSK